MAKGTQIVVSPDPRGRFLEGVIKTGETPKPGTIMQRDFSVPLVGGRATYKIWAPGTDGEKAGPMYVLLTDELQGKVETDAYAAGDRCFLYCPLPGDELNVLLKDVSGTADDHSAGELLIVDTGTGKAIATTGSPELEPFQLLEDVTDPTADQLVHVIVTGH